MKSSTVDTLRILVLLGFMVIVPATAIFGAGKLKLNRFHSWLQHHDSQQPSLGKTPPSRFSPAVRESRIASDKSHDYWLFPPSPAGEKDRSLEDHSPDNRAAESTWSSEPLFRQTAYQPQKVTPNANEFESIQQRLRQLGADYYRLEASGGNSQFFQFSCRIIASRGATPQRLFQAVGSEPIGVMRQVLTEIEIWREQNPQ